MINDKRIKRINDSLSRKQPTLQIMLDNVHSSQNPSAIVYRNTVARRSKGQIALEFMEEIIDFS